MTLVLQIAWFVVSVMGVVAFIGWGGWPREAQRSRVQRVVPELDRRAGELREGHV